MEKNLAPFGQHPLLRERLEGNGRTGGCSLGLQEISRPRIEKAPGSRRLAHPEIGLPQSPTLALRKKRVQYFIEIPEVGQRQKFLRGQASVKLAIRRRLRAGRLPVSECSLARERVLGGDQSAGLCRLIG